MGISLRGSLSILRNGHQIIQTDLAELIQLACRLGASGAAVIPASEISMDKIIRETDPDDVPMGSVSGLVLI
jgi:hydroxylamine reductase (hybrid-cluster protein)